LSPARPDIEAPNRVELDILLQSTDEYPSSAFIVCEFDVYAVFGSKGRIPVIVKVGSHQFRSSLAPMSGSHMMVFNREMRDATGFKAGDRVHMILERDVQDRQVDVPEDVKAAIEADGKWEAFITQSYTHKKEQMLWINEAKRPETRQRRIEKLLRDHLSKRLK